MTFMIDLSPTEEAQIFRCKAGRASTRKHFSKNLLLTTYLMQERRSPRF